MIETNKFIEKSQKEIEPDLSVLGYRFIREVHLSGDTFICEYVNTKEKNKLQLVFRLYSHNAFCKEVYEEEYEE